MSGHLWVVATPIGNLEDVTLRALRVLREADGILAEDTRHTRRLLSHHGVSARLRAFHAHTEPDRVAAMVDELAAGARLALVTDAGTPVVSDPGVQLVAAARDRGLAVEVVPGPSAVMAAVSVAGVRCDSFRFVGFLPRSGGRRRRALAAMARDLGATVLFESPHRLRQTLEDLGAALPPERRVAVCRELTKVHEQVIRGVVSEVLEALDDRVRGEITVVLEAVGGPFDGAPGEHRAVDDAEIIRWLGEGVSARDAAARLASETGAPKRDAYRRVLALTGD